jgi:hypothetical protein
MTKSISFASASRLSTLVCSSVAVLLSACGGGAPNDVAPAQGVQTAGLIASGSIVEQPATVQAPEAATPAASDFTLTGYDSDAAVSGAVQASATLAPALDGGTVAPAYAVPATTYKLYVSPNGNDSNAGTATAPFRTLARAARSTRPSTTVFVAPGTYAGSVKTTIHGSASGRIYFVSTTKWGAKIVGSGSTNYAWDNRGNYVDIIGFNVDGTGSVWKNGIYYGGSYGMIRANWVHHIARNVGCTSAGGSAINADHYYYGVNTDIVGNLVHDIGLAGCRYIQGIYMSTSGSIKNNVVYRVGEAAIHMWHDATNVIITNNTVTTSHTGIIVGGGDYYHFAGPSDYNRVYNNIVYDNAMGISEQGRTGTHNQYRNNLVYQNPTYNFRLQNGLSASATVSSAPYFVSYTKTGTPDLRLSASSPAIGRATSADALSYDFLERGRNTTTGYDIGAYQH